MRWKLRPKWQQQLKTIGLSDSSCVANRDVRVGIRESSPNADPPRSLNKGNNNRSNYWERKIRDKNQARNCAGAFWRVELAFRETGLFQAPLKSTRGIHCS
jgi:hypothetical protein